jgi:hypothetical protein
MRFGWEVTGAGWTEVAVGDATLVVSYVGLGPEAVSQSLLGYAAEVTFEGEPEQYGVTFQRTGDDLTIHVMESATEPWTGTHPLDQVMTQGTTATSMACPVARSTRRRSPSG